MCDICDDQDGLGVTPRAAIGPRLGLRAREIERALPGERVPEETWRIVTGQGSGAVTWSHYQRILDCLEEAGRTMPPCTRQGRRRASALRCDTTA